MIGAAVITLLKNAIQDVLPYLSKSASQLEIVAFSFLLILLLQYGRGGLIGLLRPLLPQRSVKRDVGAERLPRRTQPAAGTPLLEVTGLVRRFGGLVAVNDVGFAMKAGEILG